jgi:hypothetical protein
MLGESFRRQLLMDGQYGSIVFVATQSDSILRSEIQRNLRLNEVIIGWTMRYIPIEEL